jgi:AcrR family transcriptional regulator
VRHKDDNKHQAICDAAIELITRNGFADTSMSKIAKAAGISPATIYVYFENKEDLLNKLYLFVKREMSAELLRGVKPEQSTEEAFKIIWHNFYNFAVENPVRFTFTEQFANSPMVANCRMQSMDFFRPLLDLFEQGKQARIFKDVSLEIFHAFTFSPLMGLIKEHLSGQIVLDQKALAIAYEIAWDAVTN